MLNRLLDRLESIRVILVVIGVTCALTLHASSFYYAGHAPTEAHPEYGAVYPLMIHGTNVYLTKTQHYFANGWLFLVAEACIVAVIIPVFIKRWRSGVWQDPPWRQRPDDE
jgi:hypothetical protein